ncbi:MAG: alpha/beta hydrolase [Myxococcota bacterium]|nr:alpha/beta hydrolase [Myxococcota bacterium]
MRPSIPALTVGLVSLFACGDSPAGVPDASVEPSDGGAAVRFVEGECRLDDPSLPPPASRRCGTLHVPITRRAAVSAAGSLGLHVEVVEPARTGPATVFLTGGPGFSLAHYVPLGVLGEVVRASDGPVLLLEQRGNLLSIPDPSCVEADLASCVATLRANGVPPEALNSMESASDVADLLTTLDAAPAVVWGHSYGTVLAQRVAHQHPDVVRALVLEGVSNPTQFATGDGLEARLAILTTFGEWHAERCARDEACRAAHPEPLQPASDVIELVSRFMADESLVLSLGGASSLDLPSAVALFETQLAYHDGMLLAVELFAALVARERDGDGGAALASLRTRLGGDAAADARFAAMLAPDPRAPIALWPKACFDYRLAEDTECTSFDAALYPRELTDEVASATIATPTLFLHGALDTQTLLSDAQAIASRFSNRSDAIFERCVGHFVLRDASECAAGAARALVSGEPWSPAEVAECEARACEALPLLSGL